MTLEFPFNLSPPPLQKPSEEEILALFQQTQENFDFLAALFPLGQENLKTGAQIVTALPLRAEKGTVVRYVADKTNGVIWDLVYDGEGTYPWKYIGGRPLFAEVVKEEVTASTAYVSLETAGPSITVPLKGDYEVEVGLRYWHGEVNHYGYMSYAIGASAALDENASGPMASSPGNTGSRPRLKTALAASTALVAKYRVEVGGNGFFRNRWMRVYPQRVG